MELVWKAAALAVAAALLGLLLQKAEPVHALLLGLAAAGAVLTLTLGLFRELRDVFGDLCREAGIGAALTLPVLKSLGITVVVSMGSFTVSVASVLWKEPKARL